MKEAAVGVSSSEKPGKPAGFQTGDIVAFLRRNADLMLTAKLPERPGISGVALARATAGTLRELASDMEEQSFAPPGRSGAPAHRAGREIVCGAAGGNAR